MAPETLEDAAGAAAAEVSNNDDKVEKEQQLQLQQQQQDVKQSSSSSSSAAAAAVMKRSTSSFLNAGGRRQTDIPLVELKLENITYAPCCLSNQQPVVAASTCSSGAFTYCCGPRKKSNKKQHTKDEHQSEKQQHHKTTTVLSNVSTTISPGKLTAWMGPSGSGKSSLISVAAGMISSSSGLSKQSKIYVNGDQARRGGMPKRFVGVVWQEDLLLSNLTVFENIYYAARLKTNDSADSDSSTSSSSDKIDDVETIVDQTIQELGLSHVRDSLVGNALAAGAAVNTSNSSKSRSSKSGGGGSGNARRGISGGERKRVAVACELVVRPSLLLLDEPTSGLDATTAMALIQTLRDLADDAGHAICVVIHQPRTTVFHLFDNVLLLSRGRALYNGPTDKVRTYLESCPAISHTLPPETGIADWIMDVITDDEKRPEGSQLPACWESHQKALTGSGGGGGGGTASPASSTASSDSSSKHNDVAHDENGQDQDEYHQSNRRMSSLKELQALPKFETSFRTQFMLLTQRTFKQQRGERLTATAVYLQLAYLFFTALFWWRMPDTTGWIFERNSLLFFMLIAQANGIVIAAVTVFQRERALLRRERAKNMYGVASFFLSKTVSDMTNNVFLPLLYCLIVYWTAGFRPTVQAYLKFGLNFYLSFSTAQSMGLMMSIAIPNMQIALVLAPPITLFFMIMGGFYIPFDNMHPGVEWISWLSFARYSYTALIVNEYQGRDIPCAEDDVSISIGADSGQCPLPGEAVISSLGIYGVAENFWFNMGILAVLQVVFRMTSYILLRRSK